MKRPRYDTDGTDDQPALANPRPPRRSKTSRPPTDLPTARDSMGLLLAVLVTAVVVHDARAACDLFHSLAWEDLPRLEVVYTDSHYTAKYLDEAVFSWAPFRREVISRPAGAEGFVKLPKRWV